MDRRNHCQLEEGLTRQLLGVQVDGLTLRGTVHHKTAFLRDPGERNDRPVGVLFLNPGYLPRSARGDLYVRLADQVARQGYPAFRFDLSGLGESEGELPDNVLPFFVKVQNGEYAVEVGQLVHEIVRQHGLGGIVLAGICGGAVTSLFAVRKSLPGDVRGLILLDPTFKTFSAQLPPKAPKDGMAGVWSDAISRIQGTHTRIRGKIVRTNIGERMSVAYAKLKKTARALLFNKLPANTNMSLIRCWQEQTGGGMPLLVFNADSEVRRLDEYDYSHYLLKGSRDNISWINIEETNHSFLEGQAPKILQDTICHWLSTHFPARG